MNHFLLVTNRPNSLWIIRIRQALRRLGLITLTMETEVGTTVEPANYCCLIVDTSGLVDIARVARSLKTQWAQTPLVIVTASPTWKRTREAFLAGASDYIRKSDDTETLREYFRKFC